MRFKPKKPKFLKPPEKFRPRAPRQKAKPSEPAEQTSSSESVVNRYTEEPVPAPGKERTNPSPDFVASVNPQNDTLPVSYSPGPPAAMRVRTKARPAGGSSFISFLHSIAVFRTPKKQPVSGENFAQPKTPATTYVDLAKSSPDGQRFPSQRGWKQGGGPGVY